MSEPNQKKNPSPGGAHQSARRFQPPKGTRDFYPEDLLRRRYIIESWRRVALRHGFDEIDGPTFEDADLYKVKSGEGILNEMFGVYSGKDEADREAAGRGEPPYALRPEFTPTLARMYAARAAQLPKPTKWFCVPNFFRAERPQRGRLREFYQWNCDVVGSSNDRGSIAQGDYEAIEVIVHFLHEVGLTNRDVSIRFNHRDAVRRELQTNWEVDAPALERAFALLDKAPKLSAEKFAELARTEVGFSEEKADIFTQEFHARATQGGVPFNEFASIMIHDSDPEWQWSELARHVHAAGFGAWLRRDASIARGLAYYTGTVFEVVAEGERAVAGGGRYDNLVELFGGPPTPAVGFGMGDVVLMNLLDDKGLFPSGRALLEALSEPLPTRCDAFVISAPNDEKRDLLDAQITPLLARLRRGERHEEGNITSGWKVRPLHARRSYKATRNPGKLLKDASGPAGAYARFAVIIESEEHATLKDLDRNEQRENVALADVPTIIAHTSLNA